MNPWATNEEEQDEEKCGGNVTCIKLKLSKSTVASKVRVCEVKAVRYQHVKLTIASGLAHTTSSLLIIHDLYR